MYKVNNNVFKVDLKEGFEKGSVNNIDYCFDAGTINKTDFHLLYNNKPYFTHLIKFDLEKK